jgi:potassium efflux system protein
VHKIIIAVLALFLVQPALAAQQADGQEDAQSQADASNQEDTAAGSGGEGADSGSAAGDEESLLTDALTFLQEKSIKIGDDQVTLQQLLIALVVLIFGVILAKLIARYVGKRLLPRFHVDAGPAAAIQSIVFYLLLFAVGMMALNMASVPMTVFTVFGGALALGIGFGSQNIMNNFISGLILLIERPIAVGQIIEVGGETGRVVKIGARATLLEGYAGDGFIIPNSFVLENITKNLGITHDRFRSVVAVGVAYGSPTEQVDTLIRQAMAEHDRILKSPEPNVLFTDFGDNALGFEAHFWSKPVDGADRMGIESRLRFAIDALFREHDISISFPQRDVHLDTLAPLEVRVSKV